MEFNLSPNEVYYISLAIWFFAAFRGILLFTYYWQLKEYRWDRIWDFLKTPRAQALLFPIVFPVLVLGIFRSAFIAVLILGAVTLFRLAGNFYKHNFFRPKPTFKVLIILAVSFTAEILILYFTPAFTQTILILEIFRPLLILILMFLVGIPFWILKKHLMAKAAKKRQKLTNLKVIGITGSYGKSSTKEFLYQILQHKFKTVKTPKHINVDIGIAQTLLKQVTNSTEIFIVEMGAYKIGEIASSCRIAQPEIGILTGVNEQHLTFFGSIENTIHAKGELLASLPQDGLAIVNADSPNALESLEKCNQAKRIIKYSAHKHADLFANHIEQKATSLNFKVHNKNETADFIVPIFGEHFVQNLLACVACALELGLKLEEIAKFAKSCEVLEGNMQIFENSKKVKIIDDSYNSNPDGFISALNALANLKAKKNLVVTMGMIELGPKSAEIHEEIGKKIGDVTDFVFVTSQYSFEALNTGIKKSNPKAEVYLITDFKELTQKISEKIATEDAILFENRVPTSVINHFKKV